MASFGSLIFHFISILVMAPWTKKDNSQSGAYLYFFQFIYRYALLNVLSNQINDTVLSTALYTLHIFFFPTTCILQFFFNFHQISLKLC